MAGRRRFTASIRVSLRVRADGDSEADAARNLRAKIRKLRTFRSVTDVKIVKGQAFRGRGTRGGEFERKQSGRGLLADVESFFDPFAR